VRPNWDTNPWKTRLHWLHYSQHYVYINSNLITDSVIAVESELIFHASHTQENNFFRIISLLLSSRFMLRRWEDKRLALVSFVSFVPALAERQSVAASHELFYSEVLCSALTLIWIRSKLCCFFFYLINIISVRKSKT